ncbi:DUF481 domain-containing protein [bacterium]|nr:DUF481 domain-containing protein [bacterium]
MRSLFLSCLLLLCIVAGVTAEADTLVMKNGDRLTGEVVIKTADTLTFKTPYGEPFLIDWHKVESLTSEKPLKVLNEDDFSVRETTVIDADSPYIAGKPRARKYTINPAPWRLGEGTQFSGRVNFAYQLERGNTDNDELDTDIFLQARNLRNRYIVNGLLQNDESAGVKTADNYNIDAEYDRFLNKRLYLAGNLGYEQDELAGLNKRNRFSTSVGYQLYEDVKKNLNFEVGPGWVKEDFINRDNEFWAMTWAMKYEHFIVDEVLQFYHRQVGLWNLEDSEKALLEAWFGLRAPIYAGLTMSTEFMIDYDSQPADGAEDADTQYGVKIGYEW